MQSTMPFTVKYGNDVEIEAETAADLETILAVIDKRRERFLRKCGLAEQCNTQRRNLRVLCRFFVTLPNQKSTCTLKLRVARGVH